MAIILTDLEAAVSIWSFASFLGGDRIRTCNLQVMSLMSRPIPLPRLFPLSFFHYGHLGPGFGCLANEQSARREASALG